MTRIFCGLFFLVSASILNADTLATFTVTMDFKELGKSAIFSIKSHFNKPAKIPVNIGSMAYVIEIAPQKDGSSSVFDTVIVNVYDTALSAANGASNEVALAWLPYTPSKKIEFLKVPSYSLSLTITPEPGAAADDK